MANLLVPDLVSYQGPGTSYAGPGVGPLQDATLTDTGTSSGSPIDVFSVFDAWTVPSGVPGNDAAAGARTTASWSAMPATDASGPSPTGPTTASAAGFTIGAAGAPSAPQGFAPAPAAASNPGPAGLSPLTMAGATVIPITSGAGPVATVVVPQGFPVPERATGLVPDRVRDDLASASVRGHGRTTAELAGTPVPDRLRITNGPADLGGMPFDDPWPARVAIDLGPRIRPGRETGPRIGPPRPFAKHPAGPTALLLAAGLWGYGGLLARAKSQGAGSRHFRRKILRQLRSRIAD